MPKQKASTSTTWTATVVGSLLFAGGLANCLRSHRYGGLQDSSRSHQKYSAISSSLQPDLPRARPTHSPSPTSDSHQPPPTPSTTPGLADYVRIALENNPNIHASFERWQASIHRISQAQRLPEPTISFGYFLQSVETRIGPQQARISLQQAFPWPTTRIASTDAASATARAMGKRLEAQTLAEMQGVAVAYWNLWQLRATRATHREHLEVIRGLSEAVRARLSVGTAMLADVQQIDLAAARLEDLIRGMDEAELGAEAQLRAAMGVDAPFSVPTPDQPKDATTPVESVETLVDFVRTHPLIDSHGLQAEAAQDIAEAEYAERFPSFTLGADWLITGKASEAGIARSGQDALMVSIGVLIPLWQGIYTDNKHAAEAESRAQRATQRSLIEKAKAELISTLATLRDATRRIELYRVTLVPQAETAYQSVLGAYTVGRGTVAQTLLSQRDLLELRIELERARADHARTQARLEALVGRQLFSANAQSKLPSENTDEPHRHN
ncbi:MAG: TolC family protein [Myxococcales bacterium]|nr:TolC family protein [Myxococcales bacterium]